MCNLSGCYTLNFGRFGLFWSSKLSGETGSAPKRFNLNADLLVFIPKRGTSAIFFAFYSNDKALLCLISPPNLCHRSIARSVRQILAFPLL